MKRLMFGIALAGLLTGCAWRTQIHGGIVSTSKMDINKCYEIDRTEIVQGKDCAYGIWFMPIGSPDAQEAVEHAIADANKRLRRRGVVGIADIDVKFRFLWLYLFSQRWYTVEGHPIYEKQ